MIICYSYSENLQNQKKKKQTKGYYVYQILMSFTNNVFIFYSGQIHLEFRHASSHQLYKYNNNNNTSLLACNSQCRYNTYNSIIWRSFTSYTVQHNFFFFSWSLVTIFNVRLSAI